MVFTTAYAGIANIIPRTPDILPTANSRNRIVSGCISNVFPKTFGEMMFDSTCCTTNTTTQTNNAFVGETVNPIIAAGIKPMYGPRYGMMFVMAAVTPSRKAYGSPISRYPIKVNVPTNRHTSACPLMYLAMVLLISLNNASTSEEYSCGSN